MLVSGWVGSISKGFVKGEKNRCIFHHHHHYHHHQVDELVRQHTNHKYPIYICVKCCIICTVISVRGAVYLQRWITCQIKQDWYQSYHLWGNNILDHCSCHFLGSQRVYNVSLYAVAYFSVNISFDFKILNLVLCSKVSNSFIWSSGVCVFILHLFWKWDPDSINEDTEFIMGVKANK